MAVPSGGPALAAAAASVAEKRFSRRTRRDCSPAVRSSRTSATEMP